METLVSIFFSGAVSLIVTLLGTEYRFRKRDLSMWRSDVSSLIAEIETNINENSTEVCEKSNQWRRECLELISDCPKHASQKTIEDLNNIVEKCELISNIDPVSGGYNEEFNDKKEEIERIAKNIKRNI